MNTLLKLNRSSTSLLFGGDIRTSTKLFLSQTNQFSTLKSSFLLRENKSENIDQPQSRKLYTFGLPNRQVIRYRRATRPKKTNDNSIELTYEQAQFAEKIGVTKSWNTWDTSNLLDGKRQAENARDDIIIRKFLYGTFHDLFASEILIKRRLNTINIGFLVRVPHRDYITKIYFLVGYAEELLSYLLKCVIRIQVQSINTSRDLVFRKW